MNFNDFFVIYDNAAVIEELSLKINTSKCENFYTCAMKQKKILEEEFARVFPESVSEFETAPGLTWELLCQKLLQYPHLIVGREDNIIFLVQHYWNTDLSWKRKDFKVADELLALLSKPTLVQKMYESSDAPMGLLKKIHRYFEDNKQEKALAQRKVFEDELRKLSREMPRKMLQDVLLQIWGIDD